MIDNKFRDGIAKVTHPVARGLVRAGFTANRLTLLGVVVPAIGAAVVIRGHLLVAALIGTVACLFDLLDGAVAKITGTASVRGAYLDSVCDRVNESIIYLGVFGYCLYYRDTTLVWVSVVAFAAASLISYTRAKADSLGVDGKVGFMERAERQITIGLAALIPHAFAPLMWFLAIASSITAIQRMVVVWLRLSRAEGHATRWSRLGQPHPPRPPRPQARRRLARR